MTDRATFAELAVVLFEVAAYQARINELSENLVASGAWGIGTHTALAEKVKLGWQLGQAHQLFKQMAEYEEPIRRMIARRERWRRWRCKVRQAWIAGLCERMIDAL
jgi:hypothetical protein